MEKELLNDFYIELLEIIGEEATQLFYKYYKGITMTIPIKFYDGNKVAKEMILLKQTDRQAIQNWGRMTSYSQRQITRLIRNIQQKEHISN